LVIGKILLHLHPLFAEALQKKEIMKPTHPLGTPKGVSLVKLLQVTSPATAGETKKRVRQGTAEEHKIVRILQQ
jgi:hypothetical protein